MSPRPAWLPPLILTVISVGLLSATWTEAVQLADSGELITAACVGGVAHPPGYPLYTLLGRAFCQLPWSTPAGRVALVSVLAGLWSILALYGVVGRLTGNTWAAMVAALTLATGVTFWRYSSLAEVFALNTALCLTVVYLALRCLVVVDIARGAAWALFLGFALGCALSNHHSSILMFPVVLAALFSQWRDLRQTSARCLAGLAGLTAGLTPYLTLLVASPRAVPRWGDTSTWQGLLHHVLRRDYGTFSLALDRESAPLENLGYYLGRVPAQLGWVLWIVALLGLLGLLCRFSDRPLGQLLARRVDRSTALALVLLPLLTGPLFLLLFNITPQGVGAQVVERFHMLPAAMLCISLGVGLDLVVRLWLADSERRLSLWQKATWAVVGLTAFANFPRADVSHSLVIEDYIHNALSSVERGGLIVGQGDVHLFGLLYGQELLHLRPDVQYVDVRMLLYPWYVEQKRQQRPGFSYRFEKGRVNTLRLINSEMRRGVPVYLAVVYNHKVQTAFGGYPVGPLMRLLPPGQPPPPLDELVQLNKRLFRGFSQRQRLTRAEEDPTAALLLEPYARTWFALARGLLDMGQRTEAQRAVSRGLRWAPWLNFKEPRRP